MLTVVRSGSTGWVDVAKPPIVREKKRGRGNPWVMIRVCLRVQVYEALAECVAREESHVAGAQT